MRKICELNEINEAVEFSTQSLNIGGELYPQIDIEDTTITKVNDSKLRYSGSHTHYGENIH